MSHSEWIDVGSAEELRKHPLQEVLIGKKPIALSYADDAFAAISGVCNHVGGPLGKGQLDGDYVVCPWHYWKFHRSTGEGERGFEADCVPRHEVKVAQGRVFVNAVAATQRHKSPHEPHPLTRAVESHAGPLRVLAISTTAMDPKHPRTSTSELLLETALEHAQATGLETRLLKLSELKFRTCEGFYSKSAHACTWPCSITEMDPQDQMDQVYEGIVHWADVILIATPIRWGAASSLYQKMIERMNCVQNQITIRDKVLIRDKVAGFVITGGQDNIQAVAGAMLGFFAEIGCIFPPFPYVAHSRGWSAEDMENNVRQVAESEALRAGTRALLDRCVELSLRLRTQQLCTTSIPRGGRKAHRERGD